jgi:septum formation protein
MSSPQLYLASRSPRRAQLLDQLGVDYAVLSVDVDETRASDEPPAQFAERLALDKARAGLLSVPAERPCPVLGADTIVVVDDTVMGKPADCAEAIDMLMMLSGRDHEVITAVALVGQHEAVVSQSSSVAFRTLTLDECVAYWDTGEPCDKAGSYAIQGLAAMFISRLEGSYSGVMGLPLYETAELMRQFGITIL